MPFGEHRKPEQQETDQMDKSTEKQSLRKPFRQEQLSTQIADNFKRPSIDRPGPDTSTQKDEYLISPQIFVRNYSRATPDRTTPDHHVRASMSEVTEQADNLQRPIDTLRTDEVDNRVEDAVLTPDNPMRSGGSPPQGSPIQQSHSPRNGREKVDNNAAGTVLESFGAPAQTYPFDDKNADASETLW